MAPIAGFGDILDIEELVKINKKTIRSIQKALLKCNGSKYLPVWISKATNGPVETISADTLQGIKIALQHINEVISNEGKD